MIEIDVGVGGGGDDANAIAPVTRCWDCGDGDIGTVSSINGLLYSPLPVLTVPNEEEPATVALRAASADACSCRATAPGSLPSRLVACPRLLGELGDMFWFCI